jgi:DNA-binding NarL/FixJ family response regulator
MGLCSLIGSHENWEVCGEVADGREAVEKCRQLKPDLLILDICLPKLNGLDAARQILRHNPGQRILIVTNVESEQVIRDCLQAGVCGWIFKSDETRDLTAAIEATQQHRSTFSSRVCDLILAFYLQRRRSDLASAMPPALSPREREIVQLVGEGKTSKEIAMLLGVTLKTVETHRSNIMLKLQLHSTVELVLYAVRNEIVHVQLPAKVPRVPQNGTRREDLGLSAAI